MRQDPLTRLWERIKWLFRWFLGHWQKIDEDCEASRDKSVMGQYVRPLVVLFVVAVVLTLQEYYGHRNVFQRYFPRGELSRPDYQLQGFVWWTGWRFGGYVLLPMLAILLMPGERIRDYFISFKGFFKHLWIYLLLFGLILPAVIIASKTDSFSRTYPFFKYANLSWKYFVMWELMYALQFISLEFFFRGFMLHGLRDRMGSAAIFVMIVPYCMIHYGKPLPETLGAIGAGLILGTLAMRTKSIWGGAAIHIGVALTMDWLAMGQCPPAESGQPCRSH
jgi:membrane protease YdiL (CAAX protease family)